MTEPILSIRDLSLSYLGQGSPKQVLHGISLDVQPGEVVALVGESGSGKTTTAQAVIGLLADNARVTGGTITLNGHSVMHLTEREFNHIRGPEVSLIPQDPSSSLNPVKTIGTQVAEILRIHRAVPRADLRAHVLTLLDKVRMPVPERHYDQYSHELSGGMKQRVLIAIAIALKPRLIIADEPTSALDVTVQKHILDLIDTLRRDSGTAVLFVTHDLAVAADRADRIVVLKDGRIQEAGPTLRVLDAPQSAYTRQLLSDAPALSPITRNRILIPRDSEIAVSVRNLVQEFPVRGGGTNRAVDGLSFNVAKGTTHAIVGESGSGKTSAMRAIVGLVRPTSGQIIIGGRDLTTLRGEPLRQFRRKVQLVYQNPFGSLDPHQTVGEIIAEPLLNFDPVPRTDRIRRVVEMLDRVALPPDVADRRPRALSGGQRQRVAIARALILRPDILVLDEAVSALDVTVQAQILRLLNDLQRDLGLTYLFVSHDLSVVRAIADTVSVMHRGRQVEQGPAPDIFAHPQSDYTRALIRSIPGRALSPLPQPEGLTA